MFFIRSPGPNLWPSFVQGIRFYSQGGGAKSEKVDNFFRKLRNKYCEGALFAQRKGQAHQQARIWH